jgi:hypothetical protein
MFTVVVKMLHEHTDISTKHDIVILTGLPSDSVRLIFQVTVRGPKLLVNASICSNSAQFYLQIYKFNNHEKNGFSKEMSVL